MVLKLPQDAEGARQSMPAARVGICSSFTTVQLFNQTDQTLVGILHSTLGPGMEEKRQQEGVNICS